MFQDRKDAGRVPISAKLVADLLTAVAESAGRHATMRRAVAAKRAEPAEDSSGQQLDRQAKREQPG